MSKVVVLGGGVSGLTTALRLAESGHEVSIVARDYLSGTTSWVATAIWHLFWVEVDDRVDRWAVETLGELLRLTREADSGVTTVRGIECVREGSGEAEDFSLGSTGALWKRAVPSYEPLTRAALIERLPVGYPVDGLLGGYVIEVPIADMSRYLPYLTRRLDQLGVARSTMEVATIVDLMETFAADWYVNCTGLGSRALMDDRELRGVKGQIVRVSRDGSIREYIADDNSPRGMTYILPRGNDIVLGGSEDLDVEDSEVDEALALSILARCAALVPSVGQAEVLEHLAGVRPYRPSIRLEVDPAMPRLIHNYGHGGSGVSLSWGCAEDVVRLVG